jgi:hypothetical protein
MPRHREGEGVLVYVRPRVAAVGPSVQRQAIGLHIDPFKSLVAPALFDCFREKTRFISNVWDPECGGHAEFWKGSTISVGGWRSRISAAFMLSVSPG